MDEVLEKTHNLQVTDEEEWEIDKSLSITIAKFNLRERLCTNTEHSSGFLKRVLGGIWRLKETEWNIKVKEKFNSGLFLTFTFASKSIQNRVLSKMPSHLSNGLLILGKMENSNESWKNDLTNFPIWGKAMGVPIDFLTKNNTVRMANKAGEVIQVQNSDVSKMVADGFFRFRDRENSSANREPGDKEKVQDDGGKGKRRMVEELEVGSKDVAKENRKKVSVKKDSKEKKGKIEGKVASVSQEGDSLHNFITTEGQWHMGKVTQHFHKDDVPWIQGIPIDMYIEDSLSWPYTPNGQYMVKSGYRVGREINLHPTRCYNMEGIHKWWKMIWSMQLPPRMKLFSWRICHNWLPAKTNLLYRGMHVNPICESCGNNAETLTHVLWSCAKTKVVWKLIPWYKKCESVRDGSMFDILMSLQNRLDKSEFEEAIKVMWAILENRNRKWNKLPTMNGIQLLDWVFSAYPRVILNGEVAIQAGIDRCGIRLHFAQLAGGDSACWYGARVNALSKWLKHGRSWKRSRGH
ncbi:hypothetical protein G4B88_025330 [Cannabis sativa]|uniref:Reverse transcriptase zinc-binding domain-containing protein n=1 Tax=Cannabis sativa TaxID=3483 RepID=A0A7J6HTY0_CANSA|nr:hypothetical protein G4B88_025330 [Cannabis sativa]